MSLFGLGQRGVEAMHIAEVIVVHIACYWRMKSAIFTGDAFIVVVLFDCNSVSVICDTFWEVFHRKMAFACLTNYKVCGSSASAEWLVQLHTELKKQGIRLPERLGDDELRRFYAAVNGDFPKLISSVKKTISWRQSYTLFQPQELEAWSHLIFWHGYDLRQRPCLIIRLGLACSNLQSNDRPLFVKAIVSQIEHGVLNLLKVDQPQIMVLMDCDGLSPFGFPIHMMRSCATVLQDHYPNRLGCLLIIRLPQLARVITQTLFQVLKPATQRKVRTIGRNYQEILPQYLLPIPSFLGGNCSCSKCSNLSSTEDRDGGGTLMPTEAEHVDNVSVVDMQHSAATYTSEDRDQLKRTVIISLLVMCILILLVQGWYYAGELSVL